MAKLLIWDFDGTLAIRRGMWSGSLCEVANDLIPERMLAASEIQLFLRSGFPWHQPERRNPPALNSDDWWARLLPTFSKAYSAVGFSPEIAETLASRVRNKFIDHRRWEVFEDTIPALTLFHRYGWKQCVLSNHVPELTDLVQSLGLSDFIDRVFCSAITGFEKPNIEAFNQVLESYDCERDSAIMIGDSIASDIEGAKRAGLRTILARTKDESAPERVENLWKLVILFHEIDVNDIL